MSKLKYTKEEIEWAINELKKKHPEKATVEQAIKLLDTMQDFVGIPINEIKKDKKSGKLKSKEDQSSKLKN